jgi:hypothetical protein
VGASGIRTGVCVVARSWSAACWYWNSDGVARGRKEGMEKGEERADGILEGSGMHVCSSR